METNDREAFIKAKVGNDAASLSSVIEEAIKEEGGSMERVIFNSRKRLRLELYFLFRIFIVDHRESLAPPVFFDDLWEGNSKWPILLSNDDALLAEFSFDEAALQLSLNRQLSELVYSYVCFSLDYYEALLNKYEEKDISEPLRASSITNWSYLFFGSSLDLVRFFLDPDYQYDILFNDTSAERKHYSRVAYDAFWHYLLGPFLTRLTAELSQRLIAQGIEEQKAFYAYIGAGGDPSNYSYQHLTERPMNWSAFKESFENLFESFSLRLAEHGVDEFFDA